VRRAELRRRIAARPNSVRFEELRRLLVAYGFGEREGAGSHVVFERGAVRLPIPFRRGTVLPTYVRQALALTDGEDG
jgi:hypothetical protein